MLHMGHACNENFSSRIRKARERLGLTQPSAARAWGFSLETLRSWEQGERNPAGLYKAKLEKILKRIEDRLDLIRREQDSNL